MKFKRVVTAVVLVSSVCILGLYKYDEKKFEKNLEVELSKLKSDNEIATYHISRTNKNIIQKQYKVEVKHIKEREEKYPNMFVLVRSPFSSEGVEIDFEGV